MLKNASDVILVPKNIFFLKILNFVQSFVECKVSLADGIYHIYIINFGIKELVFGHCWTGVQDPHFLSEVIYSVVRKRTQLQDLAGFCHHTLPQQISRYCSTRSTKVVFFVHQSGQLLNRMKIEHAPPNGDSSNLIASSQSIRKFGSCCFLGIKHICVAF